MHRRPASLRHDRRGSRQASSPRRIPRQSRASRQSQVESRMSKPPYPLHPEPMKKSWIEGHPQWKIPLGLLLLIVLIVGFSATMGTIMLATYRHSDVYKQAVARASESAPVRELIGEPITPGWAVSGA